MALNKLFIILMLLALAYSALKAGLGYLAKQPVRVVKRSYRAISRHPDKQ